MTEKRDDMTLNRTFLILLLALFLTACSNNPLMRTSQATSTDAATAIDDAMAEAEVEQRRNARAEAMSGGVPEDVSAALMPSLSSPTNDEDRFDVNARAGCRAFL